MPQKLELNQVIAFILKSEPHVITHICTIAITHIMLVKFEICDSKKAIKELNYFFEEIAIVNQFMNIGEKETLSQALPVETINR
jgi:hypothetical protein